MSQSVNLVQVEAVSRYIPEQSNPDSEKFIFAYTVTITNASEKPVQLINRYWLITDSNGKKSEVSGSGVIGQQPKLMPNESFEYTSGTLVETPVATMEGHYEMQNETGETFLAPINVFRLAVPNILN